MASLLTDPLFEISGRGPPPDKTFFHFAVTKSLVIWRWWRISLRAVDRFTRPGELKESHQDFLDDIQLQSEVHRVFGRPILQYTKALCQGQYDYLERLSDSLLLCIINHLQLEDVGQLGQTSRRFRQLCRSERFWEQTVHRHFNSVSAEVASLALEVGWRFIFFASKLQLQKLLSRRRLRSKERQDEHVSDPDAKVEDSLDESSVENQISCPELDSQPGVILDPSLGIQTGTGFDTTSRCDADPGHEPDGGSEFTSTLSDQLLDFKMCVEEIQTPNYFPEKKGDCRVEPDTTETQ